MLFEGEKFEKGKKEKGVEEMEEKEKIAIEKIENLDLGMQDRMNLVLTYLKEKPTSEIEISYDSKNPYVELEDVLLKKESLQRDLEAIGLKFKILERETIDEDGFDQKEFRFLIGKNEKDLQDLEKAFLANDREKMGKLFGYPETAVKAYLKGMEKVKVGGVMDTILDTKKWWQDLSPKEKESFLEECVLNFRNFALSKEHWREELEVIRRWQRIIREKASKLYQEIIEEKPLFTMDEKEKKEWEKEVVEEELRKIKEKVDKMVDNLGMYVDEGIKETVVMMNAFGLRTSQSCEGHLDKQIAPWVGICPRIPKAKEWYENEALREKVKRQRNYYAKKAINLLNLFYRERKVPFDAMLGLARVGYGFRIQSNGAEIIGTYERREQAKKFEHYKKEMEDFTKFLKENYPEYLFKRLEI
jgi:hypothetical protein